MSVGGFGDRLADAMARRGPLCLGIDPHPELLRAWGLSNDAAGLAGFSDICVTAFEGFAVVKPQVAFFEAYGSAGFAVLENTIAALRAEGCSCLPTPNGATSVRPWRPTRPHGPASRRWRLMR